MNGLTNNKWQRHDLSVWPTVGRLLGLRNELDRLFVRPVSELTNGYNLFNFWNPALDLHEDKDNVYVKAELPGFKKDQIEISLEDETLSISGERQNERPADHAETHRSERFSGKFQRSITLPAAVKSDQVNANYKDGILTITLPKADAAKKKSIEVNVK